MSLPAICYLSTKNVKGRQRSVAQWPSFPHYPFQIKRNILTVVECAYSSTALAEKRARVEIFIFEVDGGGEKNDFLNYSLRLVGTYVCPGSRCI